MPLSDKRLEAMRRLSKGPTVPKYVFLVLEPNTGQVLGVYDSEEKAEDLLGALIWDSWAEYYAPDSYIEMVEINKDLLGILVDSAADYIRSR